jgi:hypothetical protein
MVKSDRKNKGHHEEHYQNTFIICAENQQAEETNQQDNELGRDDVSEDCAHEKAVFALKKRHAVRTVMPDVKRGGDDLRFATGGTTQSQTTPEYLFYLFGIRSQLVSHINAKTTISHKDAQMINEHSILILCVCACSAA